MNKANLPAIRLASKPAGLTFRAPASARARWDKSIKSAAKPVEGEIEILGEIGDPMWGGISAGMIKDQLKAIGKAPVLVTLNSPGGDAFEGIAIYNLLREHPGKITVHVLGLAASAASIIAMAGDSIRMGEAAFLMIHSSWGFVAGNQNDMREFAEVLDSLDHAVAGLYAARTGLSEADVLAMMQKETWLNADEAVAKGFADTAVAGKKDAKAALPAFALPQSALLAASGDRQRAVVRLSIPSPGASGPPKSIPKGTNVKTIAEQIASFEAKRAASTERMSAIMAKAGEDGRTLDEAETQEYDTLKAEVKAVDEHLVRLKEHETHMVARATPISAAVGADAAAASTARSPSGIISVKANVEKGIAFTRYVKALAMARGNLPGALAIAQNNRDWMDTTPQVAKVLMAAVAAGDTTTAGWASELVYRQNLVDEFIELLRPQTIIGKITNLRRVPFNVRMSGVNSGSSAYWVGEGKPIPVSKLGTMEVTLDMAKAAGLIVLTEELVRSSAPSAEMVVRDDLIAAITEFLDVRFVDPGYAAVANVSPASITNGVTATPATGTTSAALRTDVQTLFGVWIAANLNPVGGVWIMSPTRALAISLMLNALGQPVFPGITMNGGVFFGLPVIVSNSANIAGSPASGDMIILANAPEILLADDGQVTIDASREASIEMLDNPTNQSKAVPVATSMVSMFQTNSVALRAVRFINWKKRRSTAVAFIQDGAYVT